MPIYEFRCPSCGTTKEVILRAGQQVRPSCPSCRRRMQRVISPTAFILKGEGWYVTDYPSRARKEALEAEKKPAEGAKEKAAEPKAPAEGTKTPAAGTKEREAAPARKRRGGAKSAASAQDR